MQVPALAAFVGCGASLVVTSRLRLTATSSKCIFNGKDQQLQFKGADFNSVFAGVSDVSTVDMSGMILEIQNNPPLQFPSQCCILRITNCQTNFTSLVFKTDVSINCATAFIFNLDISERFVILSPPQNMMINGRINDTSNNPILRDLCSSGTIMFYGNVSLVSTTHNTDMLTTRTTTSCNNISERQIADCSERRRV